MNLNITKETINKLKETIDAGLVRGMGIPTPGQMCVEAAVCYALGLPHSDDPPCVSKLLLSFKIKLNDILLWDSSKSRAEGLKRLAVAQLGTNEWSYEKEEKLFLEKLIYSTFRFIKNHDFEEFQPSKEWNAWVNKWLSGEDRTFNVAKEMYKTSGNNVSAQYASEIARRFYEFTNDNNENDRLTFFSSNVRLIIHDIVLAIYYMGFNQDVEYKNKVYKDFCEEVVQILIEMKTPGSKWL